MLVASMHLTLRLHDCHSLKEKRFVLQSVKKRLKTRFNLSVSEVGSQERHDECELAVAMVSTDRKPVDREFEAVMRFLDADVRFEVVHRLVEFF